MKKIIYYDAKITYVVLECSKCKRRY